MGSQTAHGYPYPVGTDRVMDGDDAIRALAEKIDANVAAGFYAATINVTIPTAADTNGSAVLTFPAGRFTTPPLVLAVATSTTPTVIQASAVSATTASVQVLCARRTVGGATQVVVCTVVAFGV